MRASMGRGISVVHDGGSKQYLGGYRHKHSGMVLHNACSQTQPVKEAELPKPNKERFCRESQTVDVKVRSTQSKREFGTQMPRPDLLLDISRDRIVSVGSYFSATELEMRVPPVNQQLACFVRASLRSTACSGTESYGALQEV